MYSSTLSLTLALNVCRWSALRLGRFTPGKDWLLIAQEPGWTPGRVWAGMEKLAAAGVLSVDRPARSEGCYTDCAISADNRHSELFFSFSNRPILKFQNEVCIAGEDEQGGILIGHIIVAGSKTQWHSREGINKNDSVHHRHSRINKQVTLERSGECIF